MDFGRDFFSVLSWILRLVDNSSATSLVLVEAAHQEAKQKCFGTAPRIRTETRFLFGLERKRFIYLQKSEGCNIS